MPHGCPIHARFIKNESAPHRSAFHGVQRYKARCFAAAKQTDEAPYLRKSVRERRVAPEASEERVAVVGRHRDTTFLLKGHGFFFYASQILGFLATTRGPAAPADRRERTLTLNCCCEREKLDKMSPL